VVCKNLRHLLKTTCNQISDVNSNKQISVNRYFPHKSNEIKSRQLPTDFCPLTFLLPAILKEYHCG